MHCDGVLRRARARAGNWGALETVADGVRTPCFTRGKGATLQCHPKLQWSWLLAQASRQSGRQARGQSVPP